MESYQNQRHVVIGAKNEPTKEDKGASGFVQIKTDEVFFKAIRDLNKSGFTLWAYLYANKEGFSLWLSQKAVENATGMCKSRYYSAFKELEEKGYLRAASNNHYEFVACPADKVELKKELFKSQKEEKRMFYDDETGETTIITFAKLVEIFNGDAEKAKVLWKEGKGGRL